MDLRGTGTLIEDSARLAALCVHVLNSTRAITGPDPFLTIGTRERQPPDVAESIARRPNGTVLAGRLLDNFRAVQESEAEALHAQHQNTRLELHQVAPEVRHARTLHIMLSSQDTLNFLLYNFPPLARFARLEKFLSSSARARRTPVLA